MRAYILSIGSELIHGLITDSNATFLSQELVALGIELLHVTQVGDDLPRLTATLQRALDEADLVICTGGVGPTEDDLTREAIAAVLGETPEIDPELLKTIRGFFAARGLDMPERNGKQAWLVPSAEALPNPVGTAPGWFVRHGARRMIAMPGVPREMFRMWREQAVPRITTELTGRVVRGINFKTLGIGESMAEQLIADLVAQPNPVVATYAKDDGVHVRVTGFADTAGKAERVRDSAADIVRERLGPYIYSETNELLADAVLNRLKNHQWTIGVVDQGGGGRLAALIAGTPTSHGTLLGALTIPIAPDSSAFGKVHVTDLARQGLETFQGDLGIGILIQVSPIAGSTGVFEGTVDLAIAGAVDAIETNPTRADFAEVQRRAAMSAIDLLRRSVP